MQKNLRITQTFHENIVGTEICIYRYVLYNMKLNYTLSILYWITLYLCAVAFCCLPLFLTNSETWRNMSKHTSLNSSFNALVHATYWRYMLTVSMSKLVVNPWTEGNHDACCVWRLLTFNPSTFGHLGLQIGRSKHVTNTLPSWTFLSLLPHRMLMMNPFPKPSNTSTFLYNCKSHANTFMTSW